VQASSPEDFLERSRQLVALEGERNAVLNYMRLGTVALGMGQCDEAARAFDEATRRILTVYANTPDAAKARKLWYEESTKAFKGEPYERAMALFFRGLLYYREADYENARACFRSAEFQDALAEEDQNRADFVVMDWLEALCDARLGEADSADDVLKHAKEIRADLPGVDPASNVLVAIFLGAAPIKSAVGAQGERLAISAAPAGITGATVRADGEPFRPAWLQNSVSYQATTRGGRGIDYILGRKAHFKTAGEVVGTVAEAAGAGLLAYGLSDSDHRNAAVAGGGLLVAGIATNFIASRIRAQADTRAWDTLPDAIVAGTGRFAPGPHVLEITYKAEGDEALPSRPQRVEFTVPPAPARNTVVFAWSNPPQYRFVQVAR
jgi:tetratricopeptide (TPR) repeat protein